MERKKERGSVDSDEEDVYVNQSEAVQHIIANVVLVMRRFKCQEMLCLIEDVQAMGDYNVTVKREEHSNGSSSINGDMCDLRDANNALEVEDLITGNFAFVTKFDRAHGFFLPIMVSNHSPAILFLPERLPKKKTTFRFVNYIADKSDFLEVVKLGWDVDVKGRMMFKVVKKLNNLKNLLIDMNWRNGETPLSRL
nr:hypothetical protein [Tanacetum cinerariifolium]